MEIIKLYWHYWAYYTIVTWSFFVIGFYFKNKYGSDEPSLVGRIFTNLFNYLLDVPCNWFLSLFPFLQFPLVWNELLTDRLIRNKKAIAASFPVSPSEILWYRYNISILICEKLNKIDKDHC